MLRLRDAKIGDKVICDVNGKGTVIYIAGNATKMLEVAFEGREEFPEWFLMDGTQYTIRGTIMPKYGSTPTLNFLETGQLRIRLTDEHGDVYPMLIEGQDFEGGADRRLRGKPCPFCGNH